MFGKFVSISFIILFAGPLHAARQGLVVVDGAMVYEKGDFGAAVLGYLRKGKKVKVSNKTYGAFYRVKLRQGIIGYISDVDVEVKAGKLRSKRSKKSRAKRKKSSRSRPVIAGKKLGLGISSIGFVDRFKLKSTGSESSLSSQTLFLTGKYTKPFDFLDGAMLQDITLGMSLSTPSFYDQFSLEAASGIVLMGDYSLLVPVRSMTSRSNSVYWGAGLSVAYTLIDITTNIASVPTKIASEELRIGASLTGGWAKKMGKSYVFKIEPKFYFEKESYLGFHFVIQKNLN